MSRLVAAFLVAAGLGGAATPVSADTVLSKGVLGVEAATTACGILPYLEQGNLFKAVYRPAGLGTNGPSTALRLFSDVLVSSFLIEPGSLGVTFQDVNVSQATSTESLSLNFEQFVARVRLLQQTPGETDGADFLTWKLQVRKFGNVPRCTVTFRGVLSAKSTPWIFESAAASRY